MPIIPLKCDSCGGELQVNSDLKTAMCNYCGNSFVVQDAIVKNYINNSNVYINADKVDVVTTKDYQIEGGILKKYSGESTEIVIPDNVTEISDEVFEGMAITSAYMPDSVEKIGRGCFANCNKLEKVRLSNSLKRIPESAFDECIVLKEINMPENLEYIDCCAFKLCKFEEITFPKSLKVIGHQAFQWNSKLKKVIFQGKVDFIWLKGELSGKPYDLTRHYWYTNYKGERKIVLTDEGYSQFTFCDSLVEVGGLENYSIDKFHLSKIWKDEKKKEEEERKKNKELNRCEYCGGTFKGIFTKVCSACGRRKSY